MKVRDELSLLKKGEFLSERNQLLLHDVLAKQIERQTESGTREATSRQSESGSRETESTEEELIAVKGAKSNSKKAVNSKEKAFNESLGRLPGDVKVKKHTEKLVIKSATSSKKKYVNPQIVEYINSSGMKEKVYENEASVVKEVVDKLNGITNQSSDLKNEQYELRFQRNKEIKYIQLRCVR